MSAALVSGRSRPRRSGRDSYFATCAPGLEPVLFAEARQLRLAKAEQQVGGVYFEGTDRDAWRANLWLRTAVRVLRRLVRTRASSGDELYREVSALEWSRLVSPGGSLAVTVQSRESALDHTMFVAQRTKDAIVDQFRNTFGIRPGVDRENPDLGVHVHLVRDRLTISVDTSGESLHKRGWRRYQGRAPLAETLAAALVSMSGWDRRAPLVDPFCGSGTILIEAALIAAGLAPGRFREQFGFERIPGHDAPGWEALREDARSQGGFPPKLILLGFDSDPEKIEGARENARAAGLEGCIDFEVGDARALDLRPGWNAWIVTNPPYGERVGGEELRALYEGFGARIRKQCGGYHLALLSGNPGLTRRLELPWDTITELKNGALDVELREVVIPRLGER